MASASNKRISQSLKSNHLTSRSMINLTSLNPKKSTYSCFDVPLERIDKEKIVNKYLDIIRTDFLDLAKNNNNYNLFNQNDLNSPTSLSENTLAPIKKLDHILDAIVKTVPDNNKDKKDIVLDIFKILIKTIKCDNNYPLEIRVNCILNLQECITYRNIMNPKNF